jgi:23S rRNA (uridine2552-2'-O)-methyltransferase
MANYEKPDHYSLQAKREGYPARSVYKLKEMDEKFQLLKTVRPSKAGVAQGRGLLRVLDLGAAPGSWSLSVLRTLKSLFDSGGAFLAAADLSPLSREYDGGLFDGERFFFVQGDITVPSVRDAILARGPDRLVISDAAPATTGSRAVDTNRSLELASAVVDYAETALERSGNLVVKVFQGGDTSGILKRIRGLFETGRSFKPAACRGESFETYYLGLGKK